MKPAQSRQPKPPGRRRPREGVLPVDELERRADRAVAIIDPENSRLALCKSDVRYRLSMWGFDGIGHDALQALPLKKSRLAAKQFASALRRTKATGSRFLDGAGGNVFGPLDVEWKAFAASLDRYIERADDMAQKAAPSRSAVSKQDWAAREAVDLLRLFRPDFKLNAADNGPLMRLALVLHGDSTAARMKRACQKAGSALRQ